MAGIFINPDEALSISTERNTNCDCLKVTMSSPIKAVPFTNGNGIDPVAGTVITESTTGYTGTLSWSSIASGSFAGGDAVGTLFISSTYTFPAGGTYTWTGGGASGNGATGVSQLKHMWGLALFVSFMDSNNNYVVQRSLCDLNNPGNLPDMEFDLVGIGTDSEWNVPIPKGTSYKIDVFALPTADITLLIAGVPVGTIAYASNVGNLFYDTFNFYQEAGATDTLLNVGDYTIFSTYYDQSYPDQQTSALFTETGVMDCVDESAYTEKDKFVISAQCCAVEKIVELIRLREQGDQAFSYKMHEVMALINYILALKDLDDNNDCITDEEINLLIERASRICCDCC